MKQKHDVGVEKSREKNCSRNSVLPGGVKWIPFLPLKMESILPSKWNSPHSVKWTDSILKVKQILF